MAKIQTETLTVKFSKLVKDSDEHQAIVSGETVQALEQVAQELAGQGIIVEVETDRD